MNKISRIVTMIFMAHTARYISEVLYWKYCGGFFQSIFSSGSYTCRGLRWASETANTQMVTYVGSDLFLILNTLD